MLTTASCFTKFNDGPSGGDFLPVDWVHFNFNRYDLTSGTGGIDRRILSQSLDDFDAANQAYAIRHPDWNFRNLDNDFALIILNNTFDDITPVALNDNPDIPANRGDELEVIGWGANDTAISDFPDLP